MINEKLEVEEKIKQKYEISKLISLCIELDQVYNLGWTFLFMKLDLATNDFVSHYGLSNFKSMNDQKYYQEKSDFNISDMIDFAEGELPLLDRFQKHIDTIKDNINKLKYLIARLGENPFQGTSYFTIDNGIQFPYKPQSIEEIRKVVLYVLPEIRQVLEKLVKAVCIAPYQAQLLIYDFCELCEAIEYVDKHESNLEFPKNTVRQVNPTKSVNYTINTLYRNLLLVKDLVMVIRVRFRKKLKKKMKSRVPMIEQILFPSKGISIF